MSFNKIDNDHNGHAESVVKAQKLDAEAALSLAASSVLGKSSQVEDNTATVEGYDFNEGINFERLLSSYTTSGFQATNFGLAAAEIQKMIDAKFGPFEIPEGSSDMFNYPETRKKTGCTIFLGYTSNMISSGMREVIRFLAEHNLIDCIVTSAGGVEEDVIKCLAPTFIGDFNLKGAEMRKKGFNRIGNLFVPNDNYCKFEDFLMPVLDECLDEQNKTGFSWTPSKLIKRLGQRINDRSSVLYWAAKNDIPIFSPALTDGSLGDMMYFHSYKNPGLKLDIIEDIKHLNNMSVKSINTGIIILGGGVVKHHIANANLMRNGADFSLFVNTGQEFDGSDSGARPDEAVSWGKIKVTATPVKLYADATLVFPLLVAMTFAKHVHAKK